MFNLIKTFYRNDLSYMTILYKYYILKKEQNNRGLRCQICCDPIYKKSGGQLKAITRIELTSDSTTILPHIETETGTEEVYKCLFESLSFYHLRELLSSDIYIPSDNVCGNNDFLRQIKLVLLSIDHQQHIIVSTIFKIITKEFRVITESTHNEQLSAYICATGSSHYSLIEVF